jgi:hypothetical protein
MSISSLRPCLEVQKYMRLSSSFSNLEAHWCHPLGLFWRNLSLWSIEPGHSLSWGSPGASDSAVLPLSSLQVSNAI